MEKLQILIIIIISIAKHKKEDDVVEKVNLYDGMYNPRGNDEEDDTPSVDTNNLPKLDNEDLPNIDIDLKSNAKLKDIDMSMVNVNVLTLPENDIVANLSASNSAVTQIVNLEKQLGLETLNIAGTGISALDLSANTNLKQVSCTESQKTGITGVDESIIHIVPDDSDDGEDGNEDGDDGEDGNEDGDVELE